jgi:site-specific recombinase XerD
LRRSAITDPQQIKQLAAFFSWSAWTASALCPNLIRRSLASNLYAMGVKPKVIQAILRHSDIATTLEFYVETSDAESREALDKLTGLMG